MLPARTYSISIDRNWQVLYEAIWQPEISPNGRRASLNPIFAGEGLDGLPMVPKVRSRSASRPTTTMG